MNSYQISLNSAADAASLYNNIRGQVYAVGGDISFDPNGPAVYLDLPAAYTPANFTAFAYTSISTPPNVAALSSDPLPQQDVPTGSEGSPTTDPTVF